ncbi:MAG: rhomboid family intramembrane serine protease [Desulfobacterota bacterium]|nr:rhomboid family intramembrane serine protease [Thermodesulfobacteriota bacterium]
MIPVGTNLRLKRLPWVTLAIFFLNSAIHLLQGQFDHEMDFSIENIFLHVPGEFQPWTLITAAFFHADILHLLFNSLYLLVFGPFVEDKLGWKDYLFLYLWTGWIASWVEGVMHALFMRDQLFVRGLGASGAISGVMGIYLYRCYYSKVKLLVNLIIPIGIRIPAYLLLPFWFLQDFLGGIEKLQGIGSNIGFWAHVGGFLAGFGASAYLGFGAPIHRERLEFVAESALDRFSGYGEGIEALETLLSKDPQNPEHHLHLARAKTRWRASEEGRVHYEQAIRLFLKDRPEQAVEAFVEFYGKYFRLLEPPVQVRLSLLLEKTHPDLSAITLQSLIDTYPSNDLSMEEAHLHLARIYRRSLKRADLARRVYERFLERFPESEHRQFVIKNLSSLDREDG